MISPSQRPLPDNTQHSQQKNIQALGGIRTHDRSRRAAVDLRLRPRGHWDRLHCVFWILYYYTESQNTNNTRANVTHCTKFEPCMFETCRKQRTLPEEDPAGPKHIGENVCNESGWSQSYFSVYFFRSCVNYVCNWHTVRCSNIKRNHRII